MMTIVSTAIASSRHVGARADMIVRDFSDIAGTKSIRPGAAQSGAAASRTAAVAAGSSAGSAPSRITTL